MLWQKNEMIEATLEEGIIVDYFQNRFVLVIKDQLWSDYEIKALYQNPLHIYFGYERICAFFLFENVDAVDTSDASFDIHACAEADELLQQHQYDMEIYFIDKENRVCAERKITFDKKDSSIIKAALQKQMEAVYDDNGFDRALYKIQNTYEPFEMEALALVKACF